MTVYIVSLEWNEPPSEVCGDTGIIGVFATEAAAEAAGVAERLKLETEEANAVFNFTTAEGRYCGWCGEECAVAPDGSFVPCHGDDPSHVEGDPEWCDCCGAELTDSGTCNNDHDEWDVDVHVTAHEVQE